MALFKRDDLCFSIRPPVSRAAPLPEKVVKNNITKKKKLVEVSDRLLLLLFQLMLYNNNVCKCDVRVSVCRSCLWITCLVTGALIVVITFTTSMMEQISSSIRPLLPSFRISQLVKSSASLSVCSLAGFISIMYIKILF